MLEIVYLKPENMNQLDKMLTVDYNGAFVAFVKNAKLFINPDTENREHLVEIVRELDGVNYLDDMTSAQRIGGEAIEEVYEKWGAVAAIVIQRAWDMEAKERRASRFEKINEIMEAFKGLTEAERGRTLDYLLDEYGTD